MITDVDDQVVGTRGIVSDNNSKYVILLNGHNLTSSFNQGINPNHIFPMTLDNVKRIEVLTGSGSVLWGSGALLGVFNIVTEDADNLVGSKSSGTEVGGALGNQQAYHAFAQHADVGSLAGEPASVYVSGKFYESHGTEHDKVRFDQGAAPLDTRTRLWNIGPSYETLGIVSWDELKLTVRALDVDPNRDQNRFDVRERGLSDFAELAWDGSPSGTVTTHATLYGDWWRQAKNFADVSQIRQFDQATAGASFLTNWFIAADHRASLGLEVKHEDYTDYSDNFPTPSGKAIIPFSDVEGAVFGEYDWTPSSWLGLTGALRYSGSEYFADSVDPKAAVRLGPFADGSVQLKYIFQKAFLHPSAFQSHAVVTLPSGSPFTPADLPGFQQDQLEIANERTLSHEVQVIYQPIRQVGMAITGSYRQLDNMIEFNQRKDVAPPRTFANFGDIDAWAVEWEGHIQLDKVRAEANVSWANSRFTRGRFGELGEAGPTGKVLAFPDVLSNVILRYLATSDASVAAIVRVFGSTDYFASSADQLAGVTTTVDPYAALDLNFAWDNFGMPGLRLDLTAINVLDEHPLLPLAANPGVAFPERLTVYGGASYRF